MAESDKEDFEIGEVEGFSGNKDQQFSHSSLVMQSMRKCVELGSKEMREGWFNEKQDTRGNLVKTYIEDTRRGFIEAVRTLKMIMACDLDTTANKRINKYLADIKSKEQEIIKLDNEAWNNLSNFEKGNYLKYGKRHFSKMITDPLLKQHFIEFELNQWREVFAELSKLTKRIDFYKAETFEA